MKFQYWKLTDKGLKRQTNQDAVLVNSELGIYVLADGMGGHSGGEVASALAVETIEEFFKDPQQKSKSPREKIELAYKEASRRIYDKAAITNPELAGMGTTMVMGLVYGKSIYIANVGDSRCYLYKKPHMWQLSEDHSLINEQIRTGSMTEEQAKVFVGKNVITRSVGYEREVEVDIIEREVSVGECYLLCSDGLSGMVTDLRMKEIFDENNPEKATEILMKNALFNGGEDNISLILIEVR